ncbi:DNA-primase RepB domain-containing protein [Brevundimonas naejangsanensis]|uniref:DNA-primase RepB domain-containing protein n=1 Tax=Brevundimonas naejangsanensis TaxID=588932 RepID=UPI0026EA9AE4|nr:DNA-primase RepB domain-containing protein [Brevundimonas naejangsanensis]
MIDDLIPDGGAIRTFLEEVVGGDRIVLTAIPPDGGRTETETFDSAEAAARWAAGKNGAAGMNLYWTVNTVARAVCSKTKKEDMEALRFLHVDIDPRKGEDATGARIRILTALEAFEPRPTFVVFSGGGYQAFWRLEEPVFVGGDANRIAESEAYNRQLAADLGGDHCWSIDHLMRLPGTVNWPGEKKRRLGRTARQAEVVWRDGPAHRLHDFTPAPEGHGSPGRQHPRVQLGEVRRLRSLDELPEGVSPRVRTVIVEGREADPERYPSRSEAVCAVTRELVRAGCSDDQIAAVLLDPDFGVSESIREHGRRAKAEAAREIANARDDVAETEIRPRIVWSEVELSRCLDEAEAALIGSGLPVYQMGDRLVQVVTIPRASGDEDAVRRQAGSLVIAPLPKHRLLEYFLMTARFVKISRDRQGNPKETPCAPPLQFAETYMARRGAWRLPVLTGIATTPTMRVDGSVVSADGYDVASGLIIDTQGVAFPTVSDAPSKGEARAALDALIDVISEFPFVSDDEEGRPGGDKPSHSRSVALAMIVTAVARPMFNAAPIFGISAPTMATGKSLLADVPAMIVTGRRATKMSQGASEEEDEKRYLSVLMQGDPVNVVDNISRAIEGDALCTILTEETWRCRILGRSETRDVGTRALFVATGNNLCFRNDMASRAVLVSMDAEIENPGERSFLRDLRAFVPEHRAELAVAALTVLRGYIAAGRPAVIGMTPSRFEDWAVVRAALMWLGEPDPWATNERVAIGDEARAEHHDVMLAIGAAFGFGSFLATTEIIERAHGPDETAANLHLALASALPHGVSAPGLGRFLKKFSDRRVDGMWIKAQPNEKRGGRYAVMSKKGEAQGVMGADSAQGKITFSQRRARADAQADEDVPY